MIQRILDESVFIKLENQAESNCPWVTVTRQNAACPIKLELQINNE